MAPKQQPGKSKQDYQTPPEFLNAVKKLLEIDDFSIDLAADASNTVCRKYYDLNYDSLKRSGDWVNKGWNWCNPPYAKIKPWVSKAWSEALLGAKTAMLLPAGVGSNWWADHVHSRAHVIFFRPRLKFVGHIHLYPKDLALLLYNNSDDLGFETTYSLWKWK